MSDIQSLFQKDPLNLTRDDLREIAAYYREKRNAFNLGDMQAGSTKKMAKKNGTPVPKITNLDELLGDL
jgi:hypothetical protein